MKIVVPRRETNPQRNKETSPTSRLGRKLIHKLKKICKVCAYSHEQAHGTLKMKDDEIYLLKMAEKSFYVCSFSLSCSMDFVQKRESISSLRKNDSSTSSSRTSARRRFNSNGIGKRYDGSGSSSVARTETINHLSLFCGTP